MSRANLFGRAALALVCGVVFGSRQTAFGQLAVGPVTPLEVAIEKEPVSTAEPYYRAFIDAPTSKVHTNRFTFLIPQGYRLQNDPASGRMVLANKDGDRTVTFAILAPWAPSEAGPSLAACHTYAAEKVGHAVFTDEASYNLANDKGHMIDLEWRTPEDILQHKRAIYLNSGAGLIEFTATSGQMGFREMQAVLDQVIKSFHYSTNGRLRFIPLSDRI